MEKLKNEVEGLTQKVQKVSERIKERTEVKKSLMQQLQKMSLNSRTRFLIIRTH